MRNGLVLMLVALLCLSASGFAAPASTSSQFDYEATVAAKDAAVSHAAAGGAEVLAGGDNIGSAVAILSLPFYDTGYTCSYANDYDEICPYTGSASPDVVYSFSPCESMYITIDLCASLYDTKVYVYRNAYTPGAPYACNDDAGCGYTGWQSMIEGMQVYDGDTYYIVVDGYGGDCGEYYLTVSEYIPCVVECPDGALLEGEPSCYDGYVDEYNGGCNSDPAVFSLIPPSGGMVTLCGTSGVFNSGSTRDTDWYQIDLVGPSEITFCCTAEFSVQMFVIDGSHGCPVSDGDVLASASAADCDSACINISLSAGIYYLWVGPSSWDPAIGCDADYVMTVDGLCEEGPHCRVSPSLACFDSVEVGDYADMDFTITSVGCDTLVGSVSEACIPYSIVEGGGDYVLAPGESRTITVRFAPRVIGLQTCEIDAGIDCPLMVSGTGIPVFASFQCWSWTGDCLRGPNRDVSSLPACIRDDHFDHVFPCGVVVGVDAPGRHTATWTGAEAVEAFRCGYGLPAALGSDYVDPANHQLGSIYGEMIALRMTREFSCRGYFSDRVLCYGDAVVPLEGLKFAGLTVDELLAVADQALSGNLSALLPYGNSLMRLEGVLRLMNGLYEENGWAAAPPPGLFRVDDDDAPEETREPLPEGIAVTTWPNPLESGVTIGLALPAAGVVSLDVYDVQGRRIAAVGSRPMAAGYNSVTWNGADDSGAPVASGVYFLRVQVDGRAAVMHKMTKL